MSDTADFNFCINQEGPRGPKGEKGNKGFSPNISVYSDTLSEYILKITNENGFFLTTNLREHKEDRGGTYIRYDRSTGAQYAGSADQASETAYGEVRFATQQEIDTASESTVISPANMVDYLDANIKPEIQSIQDSLNLKLEAANIIQGQNITLKKQGNNITINATADNNYNNISNKPQINGIELVGNKNGNDLGLANESEIEELGNELNQLTNDVTNLESSKQDKLIAGDNITIKGNVISATGGGGGTGDVTAAGNNIFTGTNTFNGSTIVNSYDFKVTTNPDTRSSARVFNPTGGGPSANKPRIGGEDIPVYLDGSNVIAEVETLEGTQADVTLQSIYDAATSGGVDAYTKAETDELLLTKEDILTPQDPIEISDVVVNPTENMTIGSTGDIISNYADWSYNNAGGQFEYSVNMPSITVGSKFLDVMKTLGSIFIPFTFNNVYACPVVLATDTNDGQIPPIAIGYYLNEGEFVPVISFDNNAQCVKFTSNILTTISGYHTYNGFTRDYAFRSISNPKLAEANRPQFGNMYLQVFKTDINTYRYSLARHWANKLEITSADISNDVYDELSKCTHIMFGPRYYNDGWTSHPKYTLSTSLDASKKYNALTNFKEFAFTKDLATVVGTTDEFNFRELMTSGENKIKLEQTIVHTISLNSTVTTQGNTFNGASQLVQLDSTGKLPAIDGSQLTNLRSSVPSNMMTTNTKQDITASKQFNEGLTIYGLNKELKVDGGGGYSLKLKQAGGTSYIISDHDGFNGNKLILQGDTILCNRYAGTGAGSNLINIDSGNISSYVPTGLLKYWTGTEADYTGLATKDADTLYRTTDTNKVYLGTIQLGGA